MQSKCQLQLHVKDRSKATNQCTSGLAVCCRTLFGALADGHDLEEQSFVTLLLYRESGP